MIEIPTTRYTSFGARARGLIGRPPPDSGTAVWIAPCRQVHTFFMRYPIDVVHLAEDREVLAIQTLCPWRLGRWVMRAEGVLELQAGEAARLGVDVGQTVRLIESDTSC